MKLHRNYFKLLSITTAANTDQSGPALRILPSSEDNLRDGDQSFQLLALVGQNGGATSPSSKVKLQTSFDKTNWIDVLESTPVTTNGSRVETKDTTPANTPLLTWIRAVSVLGGETKPNHTAEVWLVSDGPFSCKRS